VPDKGDVVSHVLLQIDTAGSNLENVSGAIFCDCIVAIRARQATPNRLVWIGACRGSLCKS